MKEHEVISQNKLFLLVVLLLIGPILTLGQNVVWKSIRPIQMNRNDVVQALGQCVENTPDRCLYSLESENVIVYYSTTICSVRQNPYIPFGTVLRLDVHFKQPHLLSEFISDSNAFKAEKDPELVGIVHYKNPKVGIFLDVEDGKVVSLYRTVPTGDELKCR